MGSTPVCAAGELGLGRALGDPAADEQHGGEDARDDGDRGEPVPPRRCGAGAVVQTLSPRCIALSDPIPVTNTTCVATICLYPCLYVRWTMNCCFFELERIINGKCIPQMRA